MNPNFILIRQMADASARAYSAPNVVDSQTSAAALVERDDMGNILVAFQGSRDVRDFMQDAEAWFSDLVEGDETAAVHHGFLEDFESIDEKLTEKVRYFLSLNPAAKIFITGHSLGGAMAILCALEFSRQKMAVTQVTTFGQPRVGNDVFAKLYDGSATVPVATFGIAPEAGKLEKVPGGTPATAGATPALPETLRDITFRVVNQNDIVPRLPGVLIGYRHCGQEIFLEPTGGWGLNPSLAYKLFSDALGLWAAYRKKQDVLISEHFIHAYQGRIQNL